MSALGNKKGPYRVVQIVEGLVISVETDLSFKKSKKVADTGNQIILQSGRLLGMYLVFNHKGTLVRGPDSVMDR